MAKKTRRQRKNLSKNAIRKHFRAMADRTMKAFLQYQAGLPQ